MEYLRNWLLQNGEIQLYESILNYYSAPDRFDSQTIIDGAPVEIRALLQKHLDEVMRLFATEKVLYQEKYTYGQIIIWNEVLKAYRVLEQQKSIIEKITLSPDTTNYAIAMNEIKKVLHPYSRMQIALSELEETLGVDRFLDRVSEGTFLVLKTILDDTKRIVEKKSGKYKAIFQSNYSTANVYKVIAHSLIRRDDDNQVCDQFLSNNKQAIINEAGIPRGYHKKCIEFFRLYWKWLHNFDSSERESFLRSYLNFEPLSKVYIIDHTDLQRLNALRQDTQSFSEKVIKTCQKFERVFTAIDSYPEAISEANIETVAAEISSIVGFDIFSVVRSSAVKQYILEYARKVSFAKFAHIKKNLPDSEKIVLPNGKVRKNNEYLLPGFIGGIHRLRGNAYEVSFPIALSVEDYYSLDLQKPLIYGNSIVYTSDEPIEAEVDGFARPHRTFYDTYRGVLYVFYERISPGSFVYLDGIPVQEFAPFSRKTYICKYWDSQERHYKLAFCIDFLKYASSNNSMRKVSLSCNGVEIIHGQTNSNGAYRLIDKLIPLKDVISNDDIQLEFTVNNELIESWKAEVSDFYMWGKQSGLRVYSEIDLSKWYGPSSVIVFSKEEVYDASFPLEHLPHQ